MISLTGSSFPFNTGTGFGNNVFTVMFNKGKIYCGGTFGSYNGISFSSNVDRIIRLNLDGIYDTNYNGDITNAGIYTSIYDKNSDKIICGGSFNAAYNRIRRLNFDGSNDSGFSLTQPNGALIGLSYLSDGKVIVGGDFSTIAGSSRSRIAILNTDGSLFSTYNTVLGGTGYLYAGGFTSAGQSYINDFTGSFPVFSDDSFIVIGQFTTLGGSSRPRIGKASPTGGLDTNFLPGTGFNNSTNVAILNENESRVIVGGYFTTYKGNTQNRLAMLNTTNADLDTSLNIGTGFNSSVNAIFLDRDHIYVGGDFTEYNSLSYNRIVRIYRDGSIDTTFRIGTGFNNIVRYIKRINNYILIGGDFTTYNGVTCNRIIKLDLSGDIISTF